MDMQALEAFGIKMIDAVKSYVARATAAIDLRIDALEKLVNDVSARLPDIDKVIRDAVASMPVPKDGRDGDPGKDADPAAIIRAAAEAIAALPKPADGKSVFVEDVAPLIAAEVSKAVAAVPIPKDGKDASPEAISKAVADAIAALPLPKDGASFTADDARPIIVDEVSKAIAALPVPRDGRDVDPEVVHAMVLAAVTEIPTPQDGKSVTLDDVRPLISECAEKLFAEIPKPRDGQDGKSLTVDDVRQMFEAEQAKWALEFERRAQDILQRAIDRMPLPVASMEVKTANAAEAVHPDTIARMVMEEVRKAADAIPRARDGEPGRDAAQIDILPSIDDTKSYPRGVWASHDGGLIRSVRATDPVTESLEKSGWQVVVEGVSAIVISQGDDERTFSVACMLTSGTKTVCECRVPMPIERGVFREGDDYRKGDGVTFNGSFWFAQKDHPQGRPDSGSGDWRLAVKKGRDGKDAAPEPVKSGPVRLK